MDNLHAVKKVFRSLESEMERKPFGNTGLLIPPVVFGSTSLGNLFAEVPDDAKQQIVSSWFAEVDCPVFIDSAGKYGAGMALEVLGRELARRNVRREDVINGGAINKGSSLTFNW